MLSCFSAKKGIRDLNFCQQSRTTTEKKWEVKSNCLTSYSPVPVQTKYWCFPLRERGSREEVTRKGRTDTAKSETVEKVEGGEKGAMEEEETTKRENKRGRGMH